MPAGEKSEGDQFLTSLPREKQIKMAPLRGLNNLFYCRQTVVKPSDDS
jgi:hypothetical protein